MGIKMGPNYVFLFAGLIEDQIASQYNSFVPQLNKRYIDDSVAPQPLKITLTFVQLSTCCSIAKHASDVITQTNSDKQNGQNVMVEDLKLFSSV